MKKINGRWTVEMGEAFFTQLDEDEIKAVIINSEREKRWIESILNGEAYEGYRAWKPNRA